MSSLARQLGNGRWTDEAGIMHENYTVYVFAEGRDYGSFMFDPGNRPELRWRRTGIAYFCPDCGRIWGSLCFIDATGHQAPFDVIRIECSEHTITNSDSQWLCPGSMLTPQLESFLQDLPEPALKRELQMYLAQLDKEQEHEQETQGISTAREGEERNASVGVV